MARTEAIKTKARTVAVRARTEAQNIVKNLMTRTRNSTGELDKTITDNEKGLILMDALCGLHEEENDESDEEEDLPDCKFLAFDEGGHSDKITNYRELESLVLDGITDDQKPKHLDADQHTGFRKDKEAVHKNSVILQNYGHDMTRAIAGNKGSNMWHGSKFRPPNELRNLLGHRDYWRCLEKNMKEGVKYPMSKLPEKERKERLDAMLERDNHKSARGEENEKILLKLVKEDAQMGFGFAIIKDAMKKIVRGELYPFGINSQASINKKGEVVAKKQAVHDLLFEKRKGRS
eukprot:12503399-Ditylum_brightwellii.AAC.1